MPRPLLRVHLAVTIDGYIAREDGSFDYLDPFGEAHTGWDEFYASFGSIIMGRATYEIADRHDRWLYADKRVFVMTSRPLNTARPNVEPFTDPAALLGRLRREETLDIWHMGGGRSLEPFEKLNLIDRWELAVIPIRLGAGIPLFRSNADLFANCTLVHCAAKPLGLVELHYEPTKPAAHRPPANGGR